MSGIPRAFGRSHWPQGREGGISALAVPSQNTGRRPRASIFFEN